MNIYISNIYLISKRHIVLSDRKVGALNILKDIICSSHCSVYRDKLEKIPEIRP